MLPVNLVHGRKIIHVLQKDRCTHHFLQTASRRLQNACKIFYCAISLRRDIARDELLSGWINCHLPRDEYKTIRPDRLRIRANRLRTLFRRYNVAHRASAIKNAECKSQKAEVRLHYAVISAFYILTSAFGHL